MVARRRHSVAAALKRGGGLWAESRCSMWGGYFISAQAAQAISCARLLPGLSTVQCSPWRPERRPAASKPTPPRSVPLYDVHCKLATTYSLEKKRTGAMPDYTYYSAKTGFLIDLTEAIIHLDTSWTLVYNGKIYSLFHYIHSHVSSRLPVYAFDALNWLVSCLIWAMTILL